MKFVRQVSVMARLAVLCAAAAWGTSSFAAQNPSDSVRITPTAVAQTTATTPQPPSTRGYAVLYDFPGGSGAGNAGGQAIAQGRDGNLYSTTFGFGTDSGTVFEITPGGTLTIVNDIGYVPAGGVTLGTDGNFYGTNQDGGPGGNCGFAGCGQVFKVTPAGVSTILYSFTGFADGSVPQGALIEGTDGNFYGTTVNSNGGAYGTAFKITPAGVLTTLHNFSGPEGETVVAGLILGTDGNFYGTTEYGGTNGDGVVFRMTPAGAVTVLHSFTDAPDGAVPASPLVQASDGNFYGTTSVGGLAYGIVFKVTLNGVETVLHAFNGSTDGGGPNSSLVQATNGKFYGASSTGGTSNDGTLYSITTTGTFTVLNNFDGVNGWNPASPLRQNTNGILYGDTYYGGNVNACNCGVFYSLDEGLGAFASLVSTSGKEGAKVGILGQGFGASSVVEFGGVPATSVTRIGATFLSATVPAGALTGVVTVTTASTTLTSSQKFRVAPTITSFSPPSGPVGTPVTITGTGLSQTTKVTFNGTGVAPTTTSDTQVMATVPTGATTGKIGITTPGGTAKSATSFKVN